MGIFQKKNSFFSTYYIVKKIKTPSKMATNLWLIYYIDINIDITNHFDYQPLHYMDINITRLRPAYRRRWRGYWIEYE